MEKSRERQALTRKEVFLIVAPLIPVWIFRLIARHPQTALAEVFVIVFPFMFSFFYLCGIVACYRSKIRISATAVIICSVIAGVLSHVFMPIP